MPAWALAELSQVPEWRSPEIEIVRYFLPDELSDLRAKDDFSVVLEAIHQAWGQADE